MQNFKVARVDGSHFFKNTFELSVIFNDKITFDEASGFIEDVVPWLYVENVSVLKFVIFLNFVFDYEGHVTEGERKELVKDHPIMVFAVDSVTFEALQLLFLEVLKQIPVVICSDCTSLLHEVNFFLCYYVWRTS